MRITLAQDEILTSFFGKYNKGKSYIIEEKGSSEESGFFGEFFVYIFRKGVYRFYDCSDKGYKWEKVN